MSRENHWKAVLARDKRFDGAFVYGVHSTEFTAAHHVLPGGLDRNRCLFSGRLKRRSRPGLALAAVVARTKS